MTDTTLAFPHGDPNHLHEIVRLRDLAREQIAKFSGEPKL